MLWQPKMPWQPNQHWRRPQGAVASTTTWNSADKNANLTLSGGDLTATNAGTDSWRGVRSVASASGGKKFFSVLMSVVGTYMSVGIGTVNASLSSNAGGLGKDSIGAQHDGGTIQFDATNVITGMTYNTNDIIDVAFDDTAKLVWFRINGGNWNNSGTANPATGTEGFDYSSVDPPGAMYAFATFYTANTAVIANFGASAYTYAAPSGFGNL